MSRVTSKSAAQQSAFTERLSGPERAAVGWCTFTGLAVHRRHEAHVTLAAVATLDVQAVAILAQVEVLSAFVAIC